MSKRKQGQKDNATFKLKLELRKKALEISAGLCGGPPFVMETHGGVGRLHDVLYGVRGLRGVVFEREPDKITILANNRPTWAVYETDCIKALSDGVASLWPVDLLDIDPHGDPWPVMDAFFRSDRPMRDSMVVVVNDGLRRFVRRGMAWKSKTLADLVPKYGTSTMNKVYLDICRDLMGSKAKIAGYTLEKFAGYYCGRGRDMTHYLAVLTRPARP